jgi:hypothetical protein
MPRCCSRFVGYERDYPQCGYGPADRRRHIAPCLGGPKRLAFAGAGFATWLEPGNGPDPATWDDVREILKVRGRAAAGF